MPLQNVSSALNVFFYTFESLAINSLPTAISSMLMWEVLICLLYEPAAQFRFVQGGAYGGQDWALVPCLWSESFLGLFFPSVILPGAPPPPHPELTALSPENYPGVWERMGAELRLQT